MNSTSSSVEFIDEVHIPPSRPRHYYHYNPYEFLEILSTQFPQRTNPLPSGSYTIGPDDFDLIEIRQVIETQDPDSIIPVFLPNCPFPYRPCPIFLLPFPLFHSQNKRVTKLNHSVPLPPAYIHTHTHTHTYTRTLIHLIYVYMYINKSFRENEFFYYL